MLKQLQKVTFLFLLLTVSQAASPDPVYAQNGMVVSANKLASTAGIEILKKGGNAIDAAVTTGFVLAVTNPQAGNIGGGGFMVVRLANGETFTLDYREMAPAAAHRDMYLDESGNVIENQSLYSHLAVGVPGSVAGLLRAWEDYGAGKISRRELLTPAINLAQRGFHISHRFAQILNYRHDFFLRDDGAREIFIRQDGRPWKEGDLLIQKDLARTLRLIAQRGRAGFYEGKVAELIEKEMQEGNGLITKQDLTNYTTKYREPITGTYREYEIISMGPPSSGGILLVQMLNMLEYFPLDTIGWNSSRYIHILTEVERRAYADRAEHLGDTDFWNVPLQTLTAKPYAHNRIQDISLSQATPSSAIFAGDGTPDESQETTHYSVIDKAGNCISVTTTLNLSYGSGIIVEGGGFFLNNEMDDFSNKPGVPNAFGLIGNEANAILPAKRPLSSMTPTIVLKNGQPFMIIGSPGGATIITTVMQTILNVILHEMDIQEAVSVPRIHAQWLPDVIMVEPWALPKDVEINLIALGHKIVPFPGRQIGQANGILIQEDGFYGGADIRGENAAIGY